MLVYIILCYIRLD